MSKKETTYTRDQLSDTMVRAGLTTDQRHSVYRNLPPHLLINAAAGCRIYRKFQGQTTAQAVIVAACSRENALNADPDITVWTDVHTTAQYRPSKGVLFADSACKKPITGVTEGRVTTYGAED